MAIVRSISKTLDISKPYNIDNAFTICRGDNVDFTFSFTNNGNDFDISTATKARVFAKRIYNDGVHTDENPIFATELTLSNPTNVSCSFASSNTAYEQGQYLLSVILLDTNESTLTTQTIPFELFNQGYAGVVQPSQDYRDEVLDVKTETEEIRDQAIAAKNEAVLAAENASTSKDNVSQSAESALNNALVSEGYAVGKENGQDVSSTSPYYQNNAKYFKDSCESILTECEQEKTAATTAANNASASANTANNAAQQAITAKNEAVEIVDPESWLSNTRSMIANLALSKSDSGTLYFSGGSATATPNLAFDTLSVLFKTDFNFGVAQTTPVFFPFYVGKTTLGKFIHVQYGNNNTLRALINGVIVGLFNRADIAALVGDGLNALAFVFKKLSDGNIQTSLFVNGVSVQNRATATAEYPTLDSFLSINRWGTANVYAGTVGYSEFCILNFDVSAADAPYSLAEYQKGKRLPPFLSGGVYIKSNPDVVAQATPSAGNLGQTTQGTLAKSDDGYTLTLTSASTRRFWFKFDKKYPAGTWFRVRRGALTWDGMETTGSRISQTTLNVGTSTVSPYTTPVNDLPTSSAADVVFQTPIETDLIGFPTWNGADVPTATISIPYFEFEVLGASVALENYTFDGKIRDASGNESHATISGSVAGDMDNSVNQIYSAFSAKYTQENA